MHWDIHKSFEYFMVYNGMSKCLQSETSELMSGFYEVSGLYL